MNKPIKIHRQRSSRTATEKSGCDTCCTSLATEHLWLKICKSPLSHRNLDNTQATRSDVGTEYRDGVTMPCRFKLWCFVGPCVDLAMFSCNFDNLDRIAFARIREILHQINIPACLRLFRADPMHAPRYVDVVVRPKHVCLRVAGRPNLADSSSSTPCF
jgi:hypothetical protein